MALRPILDLIWEHAEAGGFAGWDPYDGLNARFFRSTPLHRIPLARQAWIQFVKRSPLNLRPLFGQRPQVLAKAVALFALGAWRLVACGGKEGELWRARAAGLLDRLMALRSPQFDECCWGYPFDWQNRSFFQPANYPNLICSCFADLAFERRQDGGDATSVRREVARFIMRYLARDRGGVRWITYTPTTDTQVHNVNLLGAALLAREGRDARSSELGTLARTAMRFSLERLQARGAWAYGEAPNQRWVDNFHTGYDLVAIEDYRRTTGETWVDTGLERAYRYWDERFFGTDGAPYYYENRRWPYDIHCAAQAILTRIGLARIDARAVAKAEQTARWTLREMYDGAGRFTFQRTRWVSNTIPMIRWAQAWMFWALAELEAARTGVRENWTSS